MLYLETQEGFTLWTGQPIAGIVHPTSIETLWTTQALNIAGLYTPGEADAVPTGKRVVSTSVQRVNGTVKFVHDLEDIPAPQPSDRPLTARQLRLGLLANGILPSAIRSTIEADPDPVSRETNLTWFDFTALIHWEHPQTQALMALAGFTTEQAAAMWIAAWDIAA